MTNNQNLSALKIAKFYMVFILISIPSSSISALLDAGAATFTCTTCPRFNVVLPRREVYYISIQS
jgi:hypothetical protein